MTLRRHRGAVNPKVAVVVAVLATFLSTIYLRLTEVGAEATSPAPSDD